MALALDVQPVRRRAKLTPSDYGVSFNGCDFITLNYLRWYPNSARAKSFRGELVHIHSNGYFWRPDARGYTSHVEEAWVVPFEEAFRRTEHIGLEKKISYQKVNKA